MRKLVRKSLLVSGAIASLMYLALSRNLWLADLEREAKIGSDYQRQSIDVSHSGSIIWKIPGDQWQYNGECQIALVLDKIDAIPWTSYQKESMALKVRVDAYATTYQPSKAGRIEGSEANRLIKNFYYTTDTPLSPQSRLWEIRSNSTIEFGLGGVERYPWEDTYIKLEVLNGDAVLSATNPRLQIVGKHDNAVYQHLVMLRLARDAILSLIGVGIVALAYKALTAEGQKERTATATHTLAEAEDHGVADSRRTD